MYKLVIIDDEKEQVEGIKMAIAWEQYEIEICGTAFNGRQGLELIEEKLPDIGIIDIKMPLLGGLELIEEVNKKNIKMQSIILSGYDDFYFAQKAIELKTTNYLLKPCQPEKILQSVLKVKNVIMEEQRRKNILTCYQELISSNIPILKEKFLTELIKGEIHDLEVITKKIHNYELNFSGAAQDYCVVLFSNDQQPYSGYGARSEETEYIILTILDTVQQSLAQEYRFEAFCYNNNILTVLEVNKQENDLQTLLKRLETIKQRINEVHDVSFTIGIGDLVSPLAALWKSYRQAEAAIETRFLSGENRIVLYDYHMSEENGEFLYPLQAVNRILLCLEKGDEEQVKNTVHKFFHNISVEGKPAKRQIQKLSLTLFSNILHFCLDKNIEFKSTGLDILKTFDQIFQAKTMLQLEEEMVRILTGIVRGLVSNKELNEIVQFALDYIHEHYPHNINLQLISEQVNYSPSYLSLLFKQETGTNFIDYLNNYRIEMAKKLLKNTSYKNYEVAYKVGYQDEKYFYQLFKRYTGLTASQYRETLLLRVKRERCGINKK